MKQPRIGNMKKYGLLILAVILLIGGGFLVYIGAGSFAIHSAGLVLILLSVGAVRLSTIHGRKDSANGYDKIEDIKRRKGPGALMWAIGVVLLVATGLCYLYLHDYAVAGGTKAFPVYVFVGVGLLCTLFWAFLIAKLIRRE